MPARPLHCKYCQGVFLPASEQPWSAVQCPHCSGQMSVGECVVADAEPAGTEQVWHNVTEAEDRAARVEAKHRVWSGRMVFLACALPVLFLMALGLMGSWRLGNFGEKKKEMLEAFLETGEEAERQEIQKAAQQFLTAASWQEMLPVVADADRVKDIMAWYFQTRTHRPLAGDVEIKTVLPVDSQGRARQRVMAATRDHAAIWMLVVKESGVWKVDWEVFANASVERWRAFLREPAGTAVELPLLVALKPAPAAYIIRSGGTPDLHEAVVLWAMERQAMAAAVLERQSPLWQDLTEIGFETAVKVIARVTVVDPQQDPPLVRLERILQRGWLH